MKVVELQSKADVAGALRRMADRIEAGDHPGESCTIILDTDVHYFGRGGPPVQAVWDMTYAIHKIMGAAHGLIEADD